ncbi:chemotaxis locus anti-sigma factor antagonist [Cellvibrio zantedeschiae]|uniref:Chemotaxis locus anti-sigma factor antagonist n=1 Tax=Cellvibrio zantedeschiae TaxID=1237077 RepID=A0ABQ3AQU4_9GAMM|nr:STAS domain-containing protein [Cellvibrio zantedeschiae]GGY63071.1 chemotaxis locus anti-sigma factor antagonist [Cellvibrio zantedeschiae]
MSGIEIIRLPSRFDYSFHRQFGDLYTPLIEGGECDDIILDFSQVEYLDSSALGMMVLLQKKSSVNNIKVKIKGARGATDEILKMANMQKIFEFI